MSTIQIVKLTPDFNEQYKSHFGVEYSTLLEKTTKAYINLWEKKYAKNANIEHMKESEGINYNSASANIHAFASNNAAAPTDTLQAGDKKETYIAIDKDSLEVKGLVEVSGVNNASLAKFMDKRKNAIDAVYAAADKNSGYKGITMRDTFDHVIKTQRDYSDNNITADHLFKVAFTNKTEESSVWFVSYDRDEERIGCENVADTPTMDSGTPCSFMVGEKNAVLERLETNINEASTNTNYEYIDLAI